MGRVTQGLCLRFCSGARRGCPPGLGDTLDHWGLLSFVVQCGSLGWERGGGLCQTLVSGTNCIIAWDLIVPGP